MEIKNDVRILHHNLKYLKKFGYDGDCLNLIHLQWAMRVGAVSWQYNELLDWLNDALQKHGNYYERDEVGHLWCILRKSYLMRHIEGMTTNPMVFRCKTTLKIAHAVFEVFSRIEEEAELCNIYTKNLNITVKLDEDIENRSVVFKREIEEYIPPMDYQTANNWWNR